MICSGAAFFHSEKLVDIAAGKLAVGMIAVILRDVEVDRSLALICISALKYFLYVVDLLYYMTRGMRLYRGRKHIEPRHGIVVAVEIVLHHLHRLKLLQTGLLGHLVLARVGIVFQMTHIGYVAHIAHLVAQMREITVENIESDSRASMAEMAVAIYRRTTHIHAHLAGVYRDKQLLGARQRVVESQIVLLHDDVVEGRCYYEM